MKKITLQELCTYCDELLAIKDFNDFCPNGLQVEGAPNIKKIAVGVSASVKTIQAALDIGADALIVHHGIFWKGDSYQIVGTMKKKLELLLKNGVSLLAYHLPLDAHMQIGNNWKVALDLGWTETSPFGPFNGKPIGVKGQFSPISI